MEKDVMPPEAATWGQPIQYYREKGRGCAMIGLILVALYGVGLTIMAITMTTGENAQPVALVGGIFTGLLLIVPSLWAYNRKNKHDPAEIWGYEDGMVLVMGKKKLAVRWEEIAAIHENLQSMFSLDSITLHAQWPHVRVKLHDGQLFSINLSGDGKNTGDLIRRKTSVRVLDAVLECIAAGQDVAFGDITLTSAGVQYQKKSIPWDKVRLHVQEGKCDIWDGTSSRWDRFLLRQPAEKMPNIVALYGIIQYYRDAAKAGAAQG